jgi:hypothetical protein
MAAEYQRRLSGAVRTLAAPVTILAAKRAGASTILTGKGIRCRAGTAGTYYESRGGAA